MKLLTHLTLQIHLNRFLTVLPNVYLLTCFTSPLLLYIDIIFGKYYNSKIRRGNIYMKFTVPSLLVT